MRVLHSSSQFSRLYDQIFWLMTALFWSAGIWLWWASINDMSSGRELLGWSFFHVGWWVAMLGMQAGVLDTDIKFGLLNGMEKVVLRRCQYILFWLSWSPHVQHRIQALEGAVQYQDAERMKALIQAGGWRSLSTAQQLVALLGHYCVDLRFHCPVMEDTHFSLVHLKTVQACLMRAGPADIIDVQPRLNVVEAVLTIAFHPHVSRMEPIHQEKEEIIRDILKWMSEQLFWHSILREGLASYRQSEKGNHSLLRQDTLVMAERWMEHKELREALNEENRMGALRISRKM